MSELDEHAVADLLWVNQLVLVFCAGRFVTVGVLGEDNLISVAQSDERIEEIKRNKRSQRVRWRQRHPDVVKRQLASRNARKRDLRAAAPA